MSSSYESRSKRTDTMSTRINVNGDSCVRGNVSGVSEDLDPNSCQNGG
jgi:hypothetical protein